MGDLWTIDSCGPHGIDLDSDEPTLAELEGPDDDDPENDPPGCGDDPWGREWPDDFCE